MLIAQICARICSHFGTADKNVPKFVTVSVVIIFSLGGALYLSLIGYYNDDNIDTDNNNYTNFNYS